MNDTLSRIDLLAKLRRSFLRQRRSDQIIEDRKLGLLAHHLLFQHIASGAVLAMVMLITPTLDSWRGTLAVTILLSFAIIGNRIYVQRLQNHLRAKVFDRGTRRRVIGGIGIAAFLWGSLTWPLTVGGNIDFMSFLIVTIVLFSICLAVLSSGFHFKAMTSAAVGGSLSLGAKAAWLTSEIGPLLPLGFAIFIGTAYAYGLVIERQTHGGVLLELRRNRASENLTMLNAELAQALAKTQLLANRDPLTQLRNRGAFERSIDEVTRKYPDRQYAILLLDIDHFKSINDQFGHQTGDGVLLAISTALEQWEKEVPGRMSARWGGEEFIVLVALRKGEDITEIAEKLRQRIEDLGEHLHWPDLISVTTSIGCAPMADPDDFVDALRKADAMLYCAKDAGRNRWRLAA